MFNRLEGRPPGCDPRAAMRQSPQVGAFRAASRLLPATLAAAFCSLAGLAVGCTPAPNPEPKPDSYRHQRLEMVRAIAAEGVRDSATLAALRVVPRHEFVPRAHREFSYEDRALPIEEGQTISQPYIVAVMTEAIRPCAGLDVLEVGTGSGYQAAVLAQIGCRVHTIELIGALADSARSRLGRLEYGAVQVRHGDGYLGWPEAAPFDAILVTAAPDSMPAELVAQLAPGGRLVAPVGGEGQVQELTFLEKDLQGRVRRTVLLPVRFVPMRKGKR